MTELAIIGIAPSGLTAESHGSIKVEDFCKELKALIEGITSIPVPVPAAGLPLKQVVIGVAVHADGKLGVIEAGIEASITLTFET